MKKNIATLLGQTIFLAALTLGIAGCQSDKAQTPVSGSTSLSPVQPAVAVATAPAAGTVVRIKAGASAAFTDSSGNVWAPDQGFIGGDTIDRSDVSVVNTKEPGIYRSEHYSMDSFTTPLANGKYLVKLHFAETFEGIVEAGQRVFSFNVQGHEFRDFDVFVKAGGALKAYVETVPVDVTDGKLRINFTANVENPQINGIEIIPQP